MRLVRLKDHSKLNISLIGSGIEGTSLGSFTLSRNVTFTQDIGPTINDVILITDSPQQGELNVKDAPIFINTPPIIESKDDDLNDKDRILADIQRALSDMKGGQNE